MTFPLAELKFAQINATNEQTTCVVRLYRVEDGGLDREGTPLYARTLTRERTLMLPAGSTKEDILSLSTADLIAWAAEDVALDLTPDRLICTL